MQRAERCGDIGRDGRRPLMVGDFLLAAHLLISRVHRSGQFGGGGARQNVWSSLSPGGLVFQLTSERARGPARQNSDPPEHCHWPFSCAQGMNAQRTLTACCVCVWLSDDASQKGTLTSTSCWRNGSRYQRPLIAINQQRWRHFVCLRGWLTPIALRTPDQNFAKLPVLCVPPRQVLASGPWPVVFELRKAMWTEDGAANLWGIKSTRILFARCTDAWVTQPVTQRNITRGRRFEMLRSPWRTLSVKSELTLTTAFCGAAREV